MGTHPTLGCVNAVCSLWRTCRAAPREDGQALASPPPHKADSPGSQPGKEAVTKAAAISCLSGDLTLLWQSVILKCRMAAKSHCVSCCKHMEKCCLHRLFGLRSVSLVEDVKLGVCIHSQSVWCVYTYQACQDIHARFSTQESHMGYVWQSLIFPHFFSDLITITLLRHGLKLFNYWGSDFLDFSNAGLKTDRTTSDSAS